VYLFIYSSQSFLIRSSAQKIAKSVQATHDFNNLLRLKTDTDESQGILKPSLEGNLTFTNVAFAYPERPDVSILKDFNLEIRDGECIALVGTSGSGKSTVAALMQRLYEPQQGSICIGIHDLRLTSAQYLRRHIAVVNQNPHLFDASVSANIMYGDRTMSEIDVRKAARAANAHDFIMQLPQGYETPVGENASLISGGQAQRLQIARAFARPSKFLILDECTSALDSENQNAVLDAISNSRGSRTVIMVTHKVPIMQKCDRIVLVDQGHVAEQGTFDELMNNKGLFASLASGGEWTGD
jgi:ATP-binding cassette, subfamily B (MDR/TAP), member 1